MRTERFLRRICLVILLVITAIGSLQARIAFAQETDDGPRITLEARNRALGDVLDQISRDTGYTFTLEESWREHSVKASLQNVPLHRALKRVLATLNHALIYETETDIRIVIYGEMGPRPSGGAPPSYLAPRPPMEDPPEPEPPEESLTEPEPEPEAEPEPPPIPSSEGSESGAESLPQENVQEPAAGATGSD